MGLLDDISAINAQELLEKSEQIAISRAKDEEVKKRRRQIVTDTLKGFATAHNCSFEELTEFQGRRCFLVGDIVLTVQQQAFLDADQAETTDESGVLWQHFVYLVGVDLTGRVYQIKIGTLKFLGLSGVRKAHNQNIGCEFEKSKVVPFIFRT